MYGIESLVDSSIKSVYWYRTQARNLGPVPVASFRTRNKKKCTVS